MSNSKSDLRRFFIAGGLPSYVLIGRQIIMSFISRQRSFEDVVNIDASATTQIIMSVTAFVVAVFYIGRNAMARHLILRTPLTWFVVYTLWASLTALWSIHGLLSAYRAFECMAWLLLIVTLITKLYDSLEILNIIRWIIYLSIFAILFNTISRAREFGFSVFSVNTLLMEQMWSTPFFFLALLLPVGVLSKFIILPISFFSLSNTAYAGMAGGLFALFTGKGTMRKVFILLIIATLLAVSLVGTEKLLMNTVFYGRKGIGLEYTSGRDKIALNALEEAKDRPIIGHGFVAGETYIITKVHRGAIGAHNGLLSAQLGTGIIGTTLFTVFIIRMLIVSGSKLLPDNLRVSFLASAILITVHTMGNPGLGSRVYGTWIPAMLVFITICAIQFHYKRLEEDENYLGNS